MKALEQCNAKFLFVWSRTATTGWALLNVLSVALLVYYAFPAISGNAFWTLGVWNPAAHSYGILPMLFGTLVCAALAMSIAFPLGVFSALGLKFLVPKNLQPPLQMPIEMLAGIPSLLFGLLGLIVIGPALLEFLEPLGIATDANFLTGGVVLAFMLLPYTTAHALEALHAVAQSEVTAFDALGGQRIYFVCYAVIPKTWRMLLASGWQAWSRALGEAVALSLVVGRADVPVGSFIDSVVSPGQTLATKLAGPELFLSWSDSNYRAAVLGLCLLLLCAAVGSSLFFRRKSMDFVTVPQ